MTENKQRGFGTALILTVIAMLAVAGFIGWSIYSGRKSVSNPAQTNGQNQTSTTPATTSPQPAQPAQVDPYANWKTYSSTIGGFTLKYPGTWSLTGFQGYTPVASNQMNGSETVVRLVSNLNSQSNNFGADIDIVDVSGSGTPYNTYGNGTTIALPNGITLWEQKQNVNYATGPQTESCPIIHIGTDNTYSMKLNNGKYMTISGSFCWNERATTTYTYNQQVNSAEWNDAVNIVKSVTFK